jgi:hypothetical protein
MTRRTIYPKLDVTPKMQAAIREVTTMTTSATGEFLSNWIFNFYFCAHTTQLFPKKPLINSVRICIFEQNLSPKALTLFALLFLFAPLTNTLLPCSTTQAKFGGGCRAAGVAIDAYRRPLVVISLCMMAVMIRRLWG